MKQIIRYLMLTLNLAACSPGPNQDLMLFNNLKFKMNEAEQTVFAGDSVTFLYKKYRGEKELVSIYSKNFDRNRLYILASTKSAELSDSLFNIKALSDRIVR